MTWNDVTLCISGLFGTIGFSLLFQIHLRKLPYAALGGLLATVVYVAAIHATGGGQFVSNLLGAAAATLYCEVMARVIRTPVTVLLLPSMVPLVPGGALYRTMSNLVIWNREAFAANGLMTIQVVLGISVGIMVVSVAVQLWSSLKYKKTHQHG